MLSMDIGRCLMLEGPPFINQLVTKQKLRITLANYNAKSMVFI